MMDLVKRFESCDGKAVGAELKRIRRDEACRECTAGLLVSGRAMAISAEAEDGAGDAGCVGSNVPVYCVVKALTGALVLLAINEGHFALDSPLSELDGAFAPDHTRAITIRQALNHTHGLDSSHVAGVPLTPQRYIDTPALVGALSQARPLFAPGTLYSHGNAGAWLLGALLEKTYATRFPELLARRILGPAGIHLTESTDSPPWCPAVGVGLQLSVEQLLQFLRWFMDRDDLRSHRAFSVTAEPPGWCFERGACGGWMYYGGGWYGSHTAIDRDSLIIRANFEHRLAAVCAVRDGASSSAGVALVRVFGRIAPEMVNLRLPRVLANARPGAHAAGYVGIYGNHSILYRVSVAAHGELQLAEFPNWAAVASDSAQARVVLRPGTLETYFGGSQVFQFISNAGDGRRYLWDSRELFPCMTQFSHLDGLPGARAGGSAVVESTIPNMT